MGDGTPGTPRMVSISEGVEANRTVNAMVSGYRIRLSAPDELAALDASLPQLAWLEIADRGKNGSIKLTDLDAAPEPRNLRRLWPGR
jgi:hypothetical protein